jgi:hypothetical protein
LFNEEEAWSYSNILFERKLLLELQDERSGLRFIKDPLSQHQQVHPATSGQQTNHETWEDPSKESITDENSRDEMSASDN